MRVHGNTRRLPKHALKLEEVKNLVAFLSNYAEENAILLPGRIPGYKRDDLQLLPSNTTKKVQNSTDIHTHSNTPPPNTLTQTYTPHILTHTYIHLTHTPYIHMYTLDTDIQSTHRHTPYIHACTHSTDIHPHTYLHSTHKCTHTHTQHTQTYTLHTRMHTLDRYTPTHTCTRHTLTYTHTHTRYTDVHIHTLNTHRHTPLHLHTQTYTNAHI